MKRKSKNKSGISLIVLVITIIVMIILAATVIIALTNAGIIGKASGAVVASDIAHIKTQVEMLTADATLEALKNNETLTQAKLIELIAAHFEGSTVNGNIVTVKNGKYDIVVEENLTATIVQHGEYTGPIKDIKVTYTTTTVADEERINLRVDLLNAPKVRAYTDDSTMTDLTNEFLNWLDWEGLLVQAANMLYPGMDISAEMVYTQEVEPILGVDYATFKADENRDALVKRVTGYDTVEILFKNMIISQLDTYSLLNLGTRVLYAKDLLPTLADKTADEIELLIKSWYNNEKTIDEITKEVAAKLGVTVNTFEEWYVALNGVFGITYEPAYIFNREQALLMIASEAYTAIHPVVIEYPNGTTREIDWYQETYVYDSYTITKPGNYTIKVTSPSGYTELIGVIISDTIAPSVVVTVEESTNNSITVEVEAKETEKYPSGIKEYRYYIKGPNEADYVLKATTTAAIYTYEGLNLKGYTEYNMLVEVEDNAGNIGKGNTTKVNWVTTTVDGAPIPKGFVASPYGADTANNIKAENTKAGGLVIYELTEDEIANGATALPSTETQFVSWTTRNQYVWVPVDTATFDTKFVRKDFGMDHKLSNTLGTPNVYAQEVYWEVLPTTELSTDNLKYMTEDTLTEVQEMYASVKKYGGFYIARYEAGIDTQRTAPGTAANLQGIKEGTSVYSVMGKIPYNYISWTWNNAMNEDTNGAVEVARRMYPENNTNYGVVSTLTYGVQWDRTVQWFIDTGTMTLNQVNKAEGSAAFGNYWDHVINSVDDLNEGALVWDYTASSSGSYVAKSSSTLTYPKASKTAWVLSTGALKAANINNIYDMAGNMMEWTMEGNSTDRRAFRGGNFSNTGAGNPVANHASSDPLKASVIYGFRPALYIKK